MDCTKKSIKWGGLKKVLKSERWDIFEREEKAKKTLKCIFDFDEYYHIDKHVSKTYRQYDKRGYCCVRIS